MGLQPGTTGESPSAQRKCGLSSDHQLRFLQGALDLKKRAPIGGKCQETWRHFPHVASKGGERRLEGGRALFVRQLHEDRLAEVSNLVF